jgi:hypothetical protein
MVFGRAENVNEFTRRRLPRLTFNDCTGCAG